MLILAGWFQVAPEGRDEWLAAREQVILETRAEQGCIEYTMSADSIDPGKVRYFERWESRADVEAHVRTMRARPPRTEHLPVLDREGLIWEAVPTSTSW